MNIGIGKKIKEFFSDAKAMLTMLLGIIVITASVGVALRLSLLSWPSVLITLAGTFIGTVIIAGAMRRFSKKYFLAESEELAESEQARVDAETELRDEKAKVLKLEQDIAEQKHKNSELEHSLTVNANVTKIQPTFKFVPAEIDFDITDFYEDLIKETPIEKHPLSGKYHQGRDFYRGVYRYSGKTFLMVDLATIKLQETDDEIIIYGPFSYSQAVDSKEEKWLLNGRREHIDLRGETEDDMKIKEIVIAETRDCNGEDKQVAILRESVKHLKMIDQMRTFTDNIVKRLIELMLKPTGKRIRFIESTPGNAPDLKLLGVFISEFNRQIDSRKQNAE